MSQRVLLGGLILPIARAGEPTDVYLQALASALKQAHLDVTNRLEELTDFGDAADQHPAAAKARVWYSQDDDLWWFDDSATWKHMGVDAGVAVTDASGNATITFAVQQSTVPRVTLALRVASRPPNTFFDYAIVAYTMSGADYVSCTVHAQVMTVAAGSVSIANLASGHMNYMVHYDE